MPEKKLLYNRFSSYLKNKYRIPVRKIPLNAALGCPHRTAAGSGCIYCPPGGGSYQEYSLKPAEQLEHAIRARRKFRAEKYIAYFQAYSNTYADCAKLKDLYDIILDYPEVIGLAVGTRPDCVDHRILKLLNSYTAEREVWVEYGLQSANNLTLERINRGHTKEDFDRAVTMTRKYPEIKICAHLIIGLPGENMDDYSRTVKLIADHKLEGVKFHPLHIIRGSALEEEYRAERVSLMDMESYTSVVARLIEQLYPGTVIQRLTGDCPGELLIAPEWLKFKDDVIRRIENEMSLNGRYQGRLYMNE